MPSDADHLAGCSQCGRDVAIQESFDLGTGKRLCPDCFIARAQSRRSVSGEDLRRLRKAVKEELAGLLPRDALRDMVSEGYRRILTRQGELDDVAGWLVNEIERMAGLALCRRQLEILQALRDAIDHGLEEQEADVRDQIKRLADLGTRGDPPG